MVWIPLTLECHMSVCVRVSVCVWLFNQALLSLVGPQCIRIVSQGVISKHVLHEPLQFLFSFLALSVRWVWGTCLLHSGVKKTKQKQHDRPDGAQASGDLTRVSGKAYWVQRHGSRRNQKFRDGTEMGFHGNALELHRIGGQKLGGVYWKEKKGRVMVARQQWRSWYI